MEKFCRTKNGYTIRFAKTTDAENYYFENFNPLNKEAAYFTGSKEYFSKEEVVSFFLKSVNDGDCHLFLIISPDDKIIGESVINEIDENTNSANYRICIFQPTEREKGIGTWAVQVACKFAFETLNLDCLSLEVFSFNKRAERCYLKAGFKRKTVLYDAVKKGDELADIIVMSILKSDWIKLKNKIE